MSEVEDFEYYKNTAARVFASFPRTMALQTYPIKLDFRTLYSRAFELKSELTERSVSESTRCIPVCGSTLG